MKRAILLFILILLTSFASAEIIINQQPRSVYNLGEVITIPVTVKTLSDISEDLEINLICRGQELNFYKNGVYLLAGEEKKFETFLILSKKKIGTLSGSCKIKAVLGEDNSLTNDFTISGLINIHAIVKNPEIYPKESILVEGYATKESGQGANGFVQIDIYYGNINANNSGAISQLEAVTNGFFGSNISAPDNMKAGAYKVKLRAYERDLNQEVTNEGYGETSFIIKQIPTSLELSIENKEIEPGASMKVKVILHDQTGENIASNSTITIKDTSGRLREKADKATEETLEFPILKNEPPAEFKVTAESNGLSNEATFKVKEKADVDILLENRTLKIINSGNVPYCNRTVLIKIGNQSLNIDVCLNVGKEQKYTITAPDGEYEIEVITDDGNDKIKEKAMLTGSAIDIKEASSNAASLTRHPFIWVFVVLILGFVAFTIFRKGYKRSIIGNVYAPIQGKSKSAIALVPSAQKEALPLGKNSLIKARNKAELSLSIQGEKQNASLVCLKIKNLQEIASKRGSGQETLQKIVDYSEEMKALVYESQENIFFIFSPSKTKTFKNETTAIELSKKIIHSLKDHNHQFKQKIEFGLSLNYGTIVGKQEPDSFKFMSMGNLVTISKRIASASHEEILLSDKIKERLGPEVKTEKETRNDLTVYIIKEIKDSKDHEKFIKNFMQRNK